MGEQPIFTTKAHVFHIDPATKKNWLPSSQGSVNVSFYYDSNRSTYRIISVDGSKAIINSTLVQNMTFTKTSQKFGQWSDARANTVYGLGFATEADLNKFFDKFNEVRELTKQQLAPPPHINGGSSGSGDTIDSKPTGPAVQNTEYMTPMIDRRPAAPGALPDSTEQLKYENNRLKVALAQSSQNAKKWEVELQTLKNNNVRLTTAMQESSVNVEEWKRQLASYKEENATLKKMVIEHEQNQPNHQQKLKSVETELAGMVEKLSVTENEKRSLKAELEASKSRTNHVSRLEETIQKQEIELKGLLRDRMELETKVTTMAEEIEKLQNSQASDKSELVGLHDKLSRNVAELVGAQNHLAKLLNS